MISQWGRGGGGGGLEYQKNLQFHHTYVGDFCILHILRLLLSQVFFGILNLQRLLWRCGDIMISQPGSQSDMIVYHAHTSVFKNRNCVTLSL